MLPPPQALRVLIDEPVVRIDWEQPPRRGRDLRRWRLVITSATGMGTRVVIDTGLSTHRGGALAEQAGPAMLKTAACLIATLGPKVILPSGEAMPAEWLADAVQATELASLVEVKRKRGRPRKNPIVQEEPGKTG
jgi:hypothetical protein